MAAQSCAGGLAVSASAGWSGGYELRLEGNYVSSFHSKRFLQRFWSDLPRNCIYLQSLVTVSKKLHAARGLHGWC